MRQLRQGPCCSCFPDRRAEDCKEGAQGVSAEKAISGGGGGFCDAKGVKWGFKNGSYDGEGKKTR